MMMMKMNRIVVAICMVLLTPLALSAAPSPAYADGGGDCDLKGTCDAWDDMPPPPPPPGHGGGRDIVEYPACSSLHGQKEKPKDDAPADGLPSQWVQVRCRTAGGGLDSLWVMSNQTGGAPAPGFNPEVIARSLLAQMQLRAVRIGMVPENCSGCRGAVGMPIWLWVDRPSRTTWGPATIRAGGVSLTARSSKVVWSFGNGDSVVCGLGTEYRDSYGVSKSPTCGYSYSQQGRYTVTATSHWTAEWNGYGQSGTINFTLESTRTNVTIGEIQVLVTNGKRRP